MEPKTLRKKALLLERDAFELLRVEVSKESFALQKLKTAAQNKTERVERLRARHSDLLLSAPKPWVRAMPVVGKRVQATHDEKIAYILSKIEECNRHLYKIERKISDRDASIQKFKGSARWLRSAVHVISSAGDAENAIQIETVIDRLSARLTHLKRSNSYEKADDLLRSLESEKRPILGWVKEYLNRRPAPAVVNTSSASGRSDFRVYLPVPENVTPQFERLGFKIDRDVVKGSGVYFDPRTDMSLIRRVQSSLPLAARQKKPKLSFQEIAWSARSQNLHQVFDKEGWSLIRGKLIASTGMRCTMCGAQGGSLLKYLPDEEHKGNSVDCHEVWSWEVLDEDASIGVQKLEDIMVLCSDCHGMFHEGQIVSKVSKEGHDGNKMRDFLRNRMSQVTGIERRVIDAQRNMEIGARQDLDSVETWIMDLSLLEEHPHLKGALPILQSANPAGITAGMIAGLEFLTEDDELHAAREVEEVYSELLAEIEYAETLVQAKF